MSFWGDPYLNGTTVPFDMKQYKSSKYYTKFGAFIKKLTIVLLSCSTILYSRD